MLKEIIQQLTEDLAGGLEHDVEARADRTLRRMLKTLVLGGIGVVFLVAGSIFVLLAAVTYPSTLMSSGLAWGLVGVIVALVGGVPVPFIRRQELGVHR
jgi:VIT1/CCC1 family predicted Fe2+/Mn2+ transporter